MPARSCSTSRCARVPRLKHRASSGWRAWAFGGDEALENQAFTRFPIARQAKVFREDDEGWAMQMTAIGEYLGRSEEHAGRKERGTHGPLSRTEIMGRLGLNTVMWNGVGMFVDLVRVPPSGTWERRRADVFATAEHWLGPTKATRGRH
jgi:hypothetical protein